jgi:DDE family transposase
VRLKNSEYHAPRNGDLRIEFVSQDLSSYSGLELFRRYFRLIGLNARIRRAFRDHQLKGDYGLVSFILVFIALWLTGGRRLRHIGFLRDDPLVKRLCGLEQMPSDRSASRWLKQFTNDSLQALVSLNSDLVTEKLKALDLPRLTLDFDGSVLTTGQTVSWAFRGYNPHKRYAPSYYPFLCHIAQTGHFLQVKNRPGNVHDSKGALGVIRGCIEQLRRTLVGVKFEVRLDAAFFQKPILDWLARQSVEFAVKVPMWNWLGIKEAINSAKYWYHHSETLSSRKFSLFLNSWGRLVELTVIRHKVSDKTHARKYVQLDLFTPDDGIYEYSVIYTNKTLRADHLWDFYNGRAAMEHQIAELKGEFGFDAIPTHHYQGNSAHQVISALAYNLVRNFQIDTALAQARPRTSSRTNLFSFASLKTLRFEWIAAAGRIVNSGGIRTLKLGQNLARQQHYDGIARHLERMAA